MNFSSDGLGLIGFLGDLRFGSFFIGSSLLLLISTSWPLKIQNARGFSGAGASFESGVDWRAERTPRALCS